MKITAIKQQINRSDRFSVFVDNEYSFSLGESALLESGLVVGQEVGVQQVEQLRALAAEDTLYEQAQKYAMMRRHSYWEMSNYLERKGASPALVESILNKLSDIDLVDDQKLAEAYVADKLRLRPTSRRKIILELRAKHVADDIIQQVIGQDVTTDQSALHKLIISKRRLSRYQDDLKLTQYLARQGFQYGDIKTALQSVSQDATDTNETQSSTPPTLR